MVMRYASGERVAVGDRVRSDSDGAHGLVVDFNLDRETICVEFDYHPGMDYYQSPVQYQLVKRGEAHAKQ